MSSQDGSARAILSGPNLKPIEVKGKSPMDQTPWIRPPEDIDNYKIRYKTRKGKSLSLECNYFNIW